MKINSKDTNWEIIRIHPKIEYLLQPPKPEKIIKSIDKPDNTIQRINEMKTSTKKKGPSTVELANEKRRKNIGNDWNPKWKCNLGTGNWEIIRLHPFIKEDRIPYQPRFKGPIRLWAHPIINSSNNIK